MDTASAFAMGAANRNKPMMVFDWHKAAEIIRERKPKVASAGLRGDWDWTGGYIYRKGKPIPQENTYTFLASTWAVPELEIDGELIPCYIMEDDTEWGSKTYWPESAINILRGVK